MNKTSIKPLNAWINQFMLPCYDAHKTTNVLLWQLDVRLSVVNFILKITDYQLEYLTWTEWWDQNTNTIRQVGAGRLRRWRGREKKRKMDMNVDVLRSPTCDWNECQALKPTDILIVLIYFQLLSTSLKYLHPLWVQSAFDLSLL